MNEKLTNQLYKFTPTSLSDIKAIASASSVISGDLNLINTNTAVNNFKNF